MIVASIDIGTNTVLLLIAEIKGNKIIPKRNLHSIPRIGKGVVEGSDISDSKVKELITILKGYKTVIDSYKCDKVICSATNAFRIASNSNNIKDLVFTETGLNLEIISGELEATYTFLGAVWDNYNEKSLVIDIGGGSTELVYGIGKDIIYKKSYPIGVIIGSEKYFKNDPPSDIEKINFEEYIKQTLDTLPSEIINPVKAIAIAGTPTTLSCIQQNLTEYNEEIIEGSILTSLNIADLITTLSKLSSAEILTKYKTVVKGREDVLLSGTIILDIIMKLSQIKSIYVSTKGIRYGAIVYRYLL